jgi:ubiquinone/menaquinone biosynthesis C-methylase UbiE
MAESTREHWDRFWIEHEAIDDVYSNEDRLLAELAKLEPRGKTIVEVGGGSGRDSLELVRRGGRVVVLDYSRPSLRTVRALATKLDLEVCLVCGDALRLPLKDSSVDIVFHQGLLEHFRDPLPMLRENARVVKPGGHVLVDVPQTYHAYTLLKKGLMAMGRWFAGWETQFTVRELERAVSKAGLEPAWSYGDWMVPGLFYRALRAGLRSRGVRLPKYPRGLWPFAPIAASIRNALRGSRVAFYTYAMIGTVGRKRA